MKPTVEITVAELHAMGLPVLPATYVPSYECRCVVARMKHLLGRQRITRGMVEQLMIDISHGEHLR